MKKCLSLILCVVMMLGLVSVRADGLDVAKRSNEAIGNFLGSHPTAISGDIYETAPSTRVPYSPGKLKAEVIQAALNALNQVRFVAGLGANVTENPEYSQMAQAATLVNAVNGSMTHYPEAPAEMDSEMYELGARGAGSSNLAWGYGSLTNALFQGWINDGDSSNIDRVGHRRWVLNPRMTQTGFGQVGSQMAMYAFGSDYDASVPKYVAWPAQKMPYNWISSGLPWSISFRNGIEESGTGVTITRRSDGRSWHLFSGSGEGYFHVDKGGYGSGDCLIFRPNGISYRLGDHYDVTVTRSDGPALNYSVELYRFDKPEGFVSRCYEVILGRDGESEGLVGWAEALRNGQMTAAEIINSFMSSDEFLQKNPDDGKIVETLYRAMLGRDADAAGKQSWVDLLEIGNTSGVIINGFCGSAEFINLCNSYGIKPGAVPGVKAVVPVPGANLTKIKAFVSRCYRTLLGREADEGGLKGWSRALATGEGQASQIIDGFIRSDEYTNRNFSYAESVDNLYRTMLDRKADEGGKAGWVDALNQGYTLQHIINGFCGSAEFTNLCGIYGITPGSVAVSGAMVKREAIAPEGEEEAAPVIYVNYASEYTNEEKVRAFVEHCYEAVFGRESDEEGIANYVRLILDGKKSPKRVAFEFIFSEEFQNRLPGNEEFIRILYRLYLNREAGMEELAGWVEMLESGASLEEIVNGFATSVEFKAIIKLMHNS